MAIAHPGAVGRQAGQCLSQPAPILFINTCCAGRLDHADAQASGEYATSVNGLPTPLRICRLLQFVAAPVRGNWGPTAA